MHFTYVETGDNYIPDYATDPYRRIPIKFGVTLSEDENYEDALKMIREAIKKDIYENTVSPPPTERYIPQELPVIRYD